MSKRDHVVRPLGSNPLPTTLVPEAPDPSGAPKFETPPVERISHKPSTSTRFALANGRQPG